jgi:nicotinamide mononucleotide transporter
MQDVFQQFFVGLKQTTFLEYIAVVTGIASVWFSKKENILVYPVGLVSVIIYIYLSFKYHLIGEAAVQLYYTIMSIYGWWLWARKDKEQHPMVQVGFSSKSELRKQILFFLSLYLVIYFSLVYLKEVFAEGAIPWGDAFASASAFTGMWLMTKKKVESWGWWIITNIASIPLFFVKGLVFTSVYYLVLLVLAFFGLKEWKQKAKRHNQSKAQLHVS